MISSLYLKFLPHSQKFVLEIFHFFIVVKGSLEGSLLTKENNPERADARYTGVMIFATRSL